MRFTFEAEPAGLSRVLANLRGLGFTEAGVRERLGLADLDDLTLKALPIYRRRRLARREPLDLAIDLWLLQGTLAPEDLARLFDAGDRATLAAAGILDAGRARVSLYPVGDGLVFSDHAWPQLEPGGGAQVPSDQVMYIGTDSRWLARVTRRAPAGAALDLCCGSGIHALLAAAHVREAVAVDINPRAVACTRFNARCRGLDHLSALQGDLYAPVAGRRFDLITANPPFVPAPAQAVGFRDGGPDGEAVQRRIVAGLGAHLAPGGLCQIVTELGERDGEPLEARLRAWLGGAAMDIHVLRLRVTSAEAYAIGHAEGDDYATFLDQVDRWHRNLEAQGYDRVVSVLLAFQWSEAPWTRVDEAAPPAREASGCLEALWAAERLARDPGLPARLRAGALRRTGPVALLEARALGDPAEPQVRARLAGQALPVEHPLTGLERDLLAVLERPVAGAEVVGAAARAGVPEGAVLQALAALVGKGLLRLDA